MIGKTVGKYRILELLGRGGMGAVYRGVDQSLGRDVAIKILTHDMLQGAALAQFEADAKALAALNHPQIAAIHEIHHAATDVLMVMELVRGETLDQMVTRLGTMTPELAGFVVAQVLGALAHAHAAGIVHRDLKPSNVMVTETGGVKLLDFGTSRISSAALMTALGPTFGASAYMAPERILGHEVDGRADLYSAGVLFYRLLTGALPFEAAGPTELIQKQLSDLPVPLGSRRPDLPEWCEEVLTRALAKSPEARFQTADEFHQALLAKIGASDGEATGLFQVPGAQTSSPEAAALAATLTAPIPTPTAPAVAATIAGLAPTLVAPIPEAPAAAAPGDDLVATGLIPSANGDPAAASAPPIAAPAEPALSASPGGGGDNRSKDAPVDPLAATLATPIPEAVALPPTLTLPLQDVPPAPTLGPTLAMPQAPVTAAGSAEIGTPPAWMPTASVPPEALAPTLAAPTPVGATTTLVMERKQLAAAGLLLATLALGVVVLAVIVLRQPAEVVVAPSAPVTPPVAASSTAIMPPPVAAPTPIVDPPIVTPPDTPPPAPPVMNTAPAPSASRPAAPAVKAAPPVAAAAPSNGNGARPTNTMPFVFEAKAVVPDRDKHRERDANVLVADGAIKISQKDDKPIYVLSLANVTSLTYSNSKQPLWDSPSGPVEAMKVEGGAFGFLKGSTRNWFGIRTTDSLVVLRVDDGMVARVMAGLQERVGLPVARLIEPKE